jgi:hypothetical protein
MGCVTKMSFKEIPTIDVPTNQKISSASTKEAANRSLEKIKVMISENQNVLKNLTFQDYLNVENKRKFTDDFEKLSYRNAFISKLSSRYKIKIP